jgi:NADH dehydrogenase (ubiquinone) 1 alpha/beta subcomplex 1
MLSCGKLFTSSAVLRNRVMTTGLAASMFRFSSVTRVGAANNSVFAASLAVPTFTSSVRCGGGTTTGRPEPETKRAGVYLLDRADVLARVTEVVKNFEKVDASKVTAESHFINDLGLDSLDVVEVVMALEQEFVLDIPDHEAEKIQSIPDAVEYLASNPMAK